MSKDHYEITIGGHIGQIDQLVSLIKQMERSDHELHDINISV